MLPERRCAIEFQRAIDLEEMEVRSHLHRPVAGIAHFERGHRSIGSKVIERWTAHVAADCHVRLSQDRYWRQPLGPAFDPAMVASC